MPFFSIVSFFNQATDNKFLSSKKWLSSVDWNRTLANM